ncbi:uncharacterized protein FTOL_05635 [Fusarium torulosum]|uniref:Uncharacterized protein n=1 Tax=Fusarium torulosum TaxID=33205 RepID=A0AAE8M871_9HYPO|nr:uncharacterized protein FTOL_05635 [Fusarium torulosum]
MRGKAHAYSSELVEAHAGVGELSHDWWKMWGIRDVTARVVTLGSFYSARSP